MQHQAKAAGAVPVILLRTSSPVLFIQLRPIKKTGRILPGDGQDAPLVSGKKGLRILRLSAKNKSLIRTAICGAVNMMFRAVCDQSHHIQQLPFP